MTGQLVSSQPAGTEHTWAAAVRQVLQDGQALMQHAAPQHRGAVTGGKEQEVMELQETVGNGMRQPQSFLPGSTITHAY